MNDDPWTLGYETGYAEAGELVLRMLRDVFAGTVAVFEKQQAEHDCFRGRAESIATMREERGAHHARAVAAEARVAELEAGIRRLYDEPSNVWGCAAVWPADLRALVGDETPEDTRP